MNPILTMSLLPARFWTGFSRRVWSRGTAHRLPRLVGILLLAGALSPAASARETSWLNDGWRFAFGEISEAERTNTPNVTWAEVTIPHCWGWEEAQLGKKYYRGPGWYRRALDLGAPAPGKRYFLRFEAAASVADVYLNGAFLAEHRGAFGAFCVELTPNLSPSGTNCLAVRVSNAPEPDIAPLGGDFNVYGGLYRPVQLIVTEDTHFALTDHASPGVTWRPETISATQATVQVTAELCHPWAKKQAFQLTARLLAADGTEAAAEQQSIMLEPALNEPFRLHLVVRQPHLWSGRPDPYLYRAVLELRDTNGLVDVVEQPLGLRTCAIDPDRGFLLNGQPYPVHGVNRHQDRLNQGWAISHADMEEDCQMILEMGATAVRCAHYQHSDYFYSLCDRAGLLVWAELPQVDQIGAGPNFVGTSRNQLLDLIRQNINHPAIFVWSLGNELHDSADADRELEDLNNLAHGEDPARPTIMAVCPPFGSPQMNKIPDLLGWNIYPGWSGGLKSLAGVGGWLAAHRDSSQHGGFCLSEYGGGANLAQHDDRLEQNHPAGPWHPEEWQAIIHESDWAAIRAHPEVWGSFVWNMFDFCNAARREGSQIARNDKGLVTFDHHTKKDAFYFYQANWATNSVLHLTAQRFVERTNAVTRVKIYSNASRVELIVNGVLQPPADTRTNATLIWSKIHLQPGENRIEARGERDGQSLHDQCVWVLNGRS